MNLILELLKQVVWLFVRTFYNSCRYVNWRFCSDVSEGVRASRLPGAYARTAHVLRVVGRFRLDPMLTPSSLDTFLYVHECFADPEYVLCDHVTLYTVTDEAAVFVETPPDRDILSSQYGPFTNVALYEQACKLVVLPLHVFHKLSRRLPDPGSLIFVGNTSRCGATLLGQAVELAGHGHHVLLSEPGALSVVKRIKDTEQPDVVEDMMRDVIRVLCKPLTRQVSHYIIKLTPTHTDLLQMAHAVFPSAKLLFMFRDGLPVVKSIFRLHTVLPLYRLLMITRPYPRVRRLVFYAMGVTSPLKTPKSNSRYQSFAFLWAYTMRTYKILRDEGIPVQAVKYEHVVARPQVEMAKVCAYLDVKFDADAVTTAFSRDSQRNSVLSQQTLRCVEAPEVREEDQADLNQIVDMLKSPCRFGEVCHLDGTITGPL